MKNQIYPCLWFDGEARAAADLYCDVFGNSKILEDNTMIVSFELHGQKFIGLNGGPMYKPNPSVSFFVVFERKPEADRAWNMLLEGGSVLMPLDSYPWSERYGWLQDRFGVNWQLSFGKMQDVGHKVSPLLMFTGEQFGKAEQAVHFYTSLFDGSSVDGILKYSAEDNDEEGKVKHAQFKLGDQVFMAMESSMDHQFTFSEGISFVVDCDTQEEIDYYWGKLTGDGGQESMCGWLKDKYGVSWQIVPSILPRLLADPSRSDKVVQAFMKMKKFNIQALLEA